MIDKEYYKKSIITLEELRPYLNGVRGMFGVPFGDRGFLMSSEEIEEAKTFFDSHFVKMAALFMGLPEKEANSKTKRKSEYDGKPYNWCWKHNKSYSLEKKVNDAILSVSIHIDSRDYFPIHFNGLYSLEIGSFYITQDGEIYQDKKSELLSLSQIREKIITKKTDEINKQLKKQQTAYNKAKKALATMTKKIKEMETELESLNKIK